MKNKKRKFIPNSLRRCRKVRKLKQKEVAEIMELKSTAMISRWESGRCIPDTLNLGRLAGVYRTTTDALLPDYFQELHREMVQKEETISRSRCDEQ
ncbi:MAG: helix-turn-helix domain-containing protein [Syntrophobacteraceae bacterium]